MQGLLADVNVEGHLPYLRRLLESRDLWLIIHRSPVSRFCEPHGGSVELVRSATGRTHHRLPQLDLEFRKRRFEPFPRHALRR
jgi:hypothetical protein